MNHYTLTKLEYNSIRELLANLSSFEGGRRKALEMQPITHLENIEKRLDETGEAMEALRYGESGYMNDLKLCEQYISRARINGLLQPEELRHVYHLLYASRMAVKQFDNVKYPRLAQLCAGISINTALEKKINQVTTEEGNIRDDASPVLKAVRNQISSLRIRIKEYLQNFIRSGNKQKMLQDALITERDGRYVVPVKQEYRHEVKGIIHDESASGATVFIEPIAVVNNNNRIRELQAEERREIERILAEVSAMVAVFASELLHNQEVLSLLDLIMARARLAYKMGAFRPEINNLGIIDISRGIHPLLGDSAVPVDIRLGMEFDILVLTGPNTGGKTVTLKMVGLLTLMAMSGLYIPARENSRISVFDNVYIDIGDEQSIEQSLSTFSGHMKNIIEIMEKADRRSLVLIDELGAGTDPVEGTALGRVVVEELCAKKARAIVTTHQSELKSMAYMNERVENACVEFNPITLQPTYRLTIGMPGQSNAFEIAARLGLNASLVSRARRLVPKRDQEIGSMIRELKESRYLLENERAEIARTRAELEREKSILAQEKEEFVREREEILEKTRDEANRYVRQIKNQADIAIQDLKEILKEKQKPPRWHEVEEKRKKIRELQVKVPLEAESYDGLPEEIRPGDYVLLKNINQKGYILTPPDEHGELTVQAGIMKINVNRQHIKRIQSPEERNYRVRNQSFLEKARNISKEIDVRGKTSDEAMQELDKYLEDANLVGLDSVMIIHGKGTGALRTAIRKYLKNHHYVKSFRDGLMEEGGTGVTVIQFKD